MASITYDEAAHLLRRMGFGGPPNEINALVALGREGAVDQLINYDRIDNSEMENALPALIPLYKINSSTFMRRWWFLRMMLTKRPFEEKLTLFWHNHFATSEVKTFFLQIFYQNLTLRTYALARFDDLLLQVAQDAAMLFWLDGINSIKGNANENFARELQELFTLGITDVVTGEANYSEQDVKEIARAFTGWSCVIPNPKKLKPNKPSKYLFQIKGNDHDDGGKTIYGQTANFGGEDVLAVIAARRATPRYLVKKLFEFFVYPLNDDATDRATIEKFADVYMSSDHSIKALLRAIFVSDEFFSDRARFALIKNPVELIVGSLRMLSAHYVDIGAEEGSAGLKYIPLYRASSDMGMDLFAPPDVSGWKLNAAWINTSTLLARYNFANTLISNRQNDAQTFGPLVTNSQLKRNTTTTAEGTVNNFLHLLGPLNVDAETVQRLASYLQTDDKGKPVEFVNNNATINERVRELIHQIMCLSEFQLN